MASVPILDYRNIIDSFKAKRLTERDVEQHLSDLMLFLDFSASLNRASGMKDISNVILLTLMGYTASRRAIFIRSSDNGLIVQERKGFRNPTFPKLQEFILEAPYPEYHLCGDEKKHSWDELCEILRVRLIIPLQNEQKLLALIGLGERDKGKQFTPHQLQIIVSLINMCTAALENAANLQSLHDLNRQLGLKIYQLNTLFELSKDFNAVWDSETIFRILGSSLIGQLLVSRCAVFQF